MRRLVTAVHIQALHGTTRSGCTASLWGEQVAHLCKLLLSSHSSRNLLGTALQRSCCVFNDSYSRKQNGVDTLRTVQTSWRACGLCAWYTAEVRSWAVWTIHPCSFTGSCILNSFILPICPNYCTKFAVNPCTFRNTLQCRRCVINC